jgi:hypothetical protein
VGDFNALHGNLVGIRLEVGGGDFHRKAAGGRPRSNGYVLFVQQPDHHVAPAIDPLVGDLVQPVVEVEVGFELTPFQDDVAILAESGHSYSVEVPAVAVPVFDHLHLHVEAGDFGETDFCAPPVHLKVKPG